jgi:hypothetical protein
MLLHQQLTYLNLNEQSESLLNKLQIVHCGISTLLSVKKWKPNQRKKE